MSQMFLESVSILLVPWFLYAGRLYDPSPVKVPKLHDLCTENILEGRGASFVPWISWTHFEDMFGRRAAAKPV